MASRCPPVRPSLRHLISNNSRQTCTFWRYKRHTTISRDRQWTLGKKISQTRMFFLDPINVGLLSSPRKSILSSDMTRWILKETRLKDLSLLKTEKPESSYDYVRHSQLYTRRTTDLGSSNCTVIKPNQISFSPKIWFEHCIYLFLTVRCWAVLSGLC